MDELNQNVEICKSKDFGNLGKKKQELSTEKHQKEYAKEAIDENRGILDEKTFTRRKKKEIDIYKIMINRSSIESHNILKSFYRVIEGVDTRKIGYNMNIAQKKRQELVEAATKSCFVGISNHLKNRRKLKNGRKLKLSTRWF
ncbi:hypothetical protein Zmor_000293 [Zophobas morio]|uniref:Uncharacterized protein n=1 Tax=Zophobas morio TaxID=2755281 RepID=A0AA38MR45_9CUCU|nr:hypothetical protein Zmor_000293 [Zophobas morio]